MSGIDTAVTAAIKHIGIGTASSGKTFEFLRKKGFDESVCRDAVEELKKRKYIDDRKACEKVIAYRSGKKTESRAYMLSRFEQAGVEKSVGLDVLSSMESDSQRCYELFSSLGLDKSFDLREEYLTCAARRGFGYELSSAVFDLYISDV